MRPGQEQTEPATALPGLLPLPLPCMACMKGVDAAGGMATEARAAAARSTGDDRGRKGPCLVPRNLEIWVPYHFRFYLAISV